MPNRSDRVLTADQACELLNVTRRWLIREGVYKGKVPCLRPPGSNIILFLESDLWAVLKAWRVVDEANKPHGRPPKQMTGRR